MFSGIYPADLDTTPITGTMILSGTIQPLPAVIAYQSAPPGAPALNSRYIVKTPAAALSAWVGHNEEIAQWTGAAWQFTVPAAHRTVVYINPATDMLVEFTGQTWIETGVKFTNYNGSTALVNADATNGTMVITLGTYDPTATTTNRFIAEKVIATVVGGAAITAEDWPLKRIKPYKAIKVALSGGTGYIRTQGKVAVVPA